MRPPVGKVTVTRSSVCARLRWPSRALCAALAAGLTVAFAACGGGGSAGTATAANDAVGLTFRALWERASRPAIASSRFRPAAFEGTDEIPASVSLVEVRINGAGRPITRCFVDPRQTRTAIIGGLTAGQATVQVLGYDIPAPPGTGTANCNILPAPLDVAQIPPSFASAPVSVRIPQGQTADAGVLQLSAQPFATDFVPAPGTDDVNGSAPVSFVIATAVGDVSRASINITIAGVPVVVAGQEQSGATITACDDAEGPVCGSHSDRQLTGFVFRFQPPPFPAETTIDVV